MQSLQYRYLFNLHYVSTLSINSSLSSSQDTIKIKNFVFYLLFLKYTFNLFTKVKLSFYFLHKKKIRFVTTKAPYKNKLTRNHYVKKCFYYTIKIFFNNSTSLLNFNPSSYYFIYNLLFKIELAYLTLCFVKTNLLYTSNSKLFFLNAHNSI